MPRFSRSVPAWMAVVLLSALTIPGMGPAAAQGSTQVEIAIVVLPPSEEPEPLADMATTMSAMLFVGNSGQSHDDAGDAASLDLQVVDVNGSDQGWVIKLMQPATHEAGAAQSADTFLLQAGASPEHRSSTAHADWLSAGQPLDRMTPVLRSGAGDLAGVHRVQVDLATHPVSGTPLVIALGAAP